MAIALGMGASDLETFADKFCGEMNFHIAGKGKLGFGSRSLALHSDGDTVNFILTTSGRFVDRPDITGNSCDAFITFVHGKTPCMGSVDKVRIVDYQFDHTYTLREFLDRLEATGW